RLETFATRRRLAFPLAERSAYAASEGLDRDELRRMCAALVDGLYIVSRSHDESDDGRRACLAAARMLLDVRRHPLRRAIESASRKHPGADDDNRNAGLQSAVGVSWDELSELKYALK